jgi:hypothetical protein
MAMHKQDFVSGSLHKIKDKISESTPNKESDPSENGAKQFVSETKTGLKPLNDKNFKKALEKRRDEFMKVRRDVMGRLTQALAVIPDEMKSYELHIEESKSAENLFNKMLDELTALDDSGWDEENYSSELGDAMKKVEDMRLEFIRRSAKLDKLKKGAEVSSPQKGSSESSLIELTSLSFSQIFRMGFIFSLPLLFILLFAAALIAAAFYISMRV